MDTLKQPGVYPGLSFAEYAAIEAINWHMLEPFRVSSLNGHRAMQRPVESTQTMEDMEAMHAAILEPDRFGKEYAVEPTFDGHPNSTAHKQAKAAWREAHAKSVPLDPDTAKEIAAMQAAVMAHPTASKIITAKGKAELTIVWVDPGTGLLCKGRIDWLCRFPMGLIDLASPTPDAMTVGLADIKGTKCGTNGDFQKHKGFVESFNLDRCKYGYHGQLAWYNRGLQVLAPAPVIPLIIAVQNDSPFDVMVADMRPLMEIGEKSCDDLLAKYIAGNKTKKWPGASDYAVPLYPFVWEEDRNETRKENP